MTHLQQFIASLAGSLAWPVAAAVIVLLLRKPLARFLDQAESVQVKAAGIEAQLSRGLDKAGVGVAVAVAETNAGNSGKSLSMEGLSKLAVENPAAAILQGYEALEAELRDILGAPEPGADRTYLPTAAVREAAAKDLVHESSVAAVDGLAVMRDLVAHGGADRVTPDQAREYLAFVNATIYALRHPGRS